jgi:hypothetical protein
MPFLKNVAKDLVEKRLWPVAVLLVAALVAVPVLVSRGGSTPAAAPVAQPAGGTAGSAEAPTASRVTLVTGDDVVHHRGAVRDPFRPAATMRSSTASPATAAAPATAASTPAASAVTASKAAAPSPGASSSTTGAPSAGSSATGPSAGGSSGAGATKPKATRKTSTPAKPTAEDPTDTYHVSLRFGVNGGKVKTIKDVARLSPLPSETDPFFVFLGVLQTEKTHEQRAVFMVSSDATPTGEGSCHPTAQDCETVELAKGQTVFFDYTAPDGTPTQYQLQLVGIHKTEITSAAKAQAAIARHSAVGQELLRDAATRNVRAAAGARAYRFIPATGLLVRAKRRHVTAQAAAAGTMIPGLALVDGKDQPGIPVWHSPKRKHAR